MWGFLTAGQNLPFTVALAIMGFITLIEAAALLSGGGLSSALESILPDTELDIDSPDAAGDGTLSALLSWLRVGEVPLLILLVVFLTCFGAAGLAVQSITHDALGFLLPGWLASIPAFVASLPLLRLVGGFIGKVMPRDESSAVSRDALIGRIATILTGTSQAGSAAQGKVRDAYHQDHYVMIEPDNAEDVFPQGKRVLLVRRAGGTYFAIGDINETLLD